MKKQFVLFLLAFSCIFTVGAQDRIVRTDGSEVEARVTEITPGEIRYKRFSNPDGPTYILPVEQVRYIAYPNGEKDLFNEFTETVEVEAPNVIPATPLVPATPAALRAYAVGDYYENGTVKGVVCSVNEDGTHGLILSVNEISLPWLVLDKTYMRDVDATDANDGVANMRAVERYIARHNLSWSNFPAFQWCREQGEGWYLPSINELLEICANYNGGSRTIVDREARSRFNDMLRKHGGERMDRLAYYYSSTERDMKKAICSHVDLQPPFVGDVAKGTKNLVRAVYRF